jgi:outer membrane protein, heavy metal efflux system
MTKFKVFAFAFVLAAGSPALKASPQEKLTVDQAVREALTRNLSLLAEKYNLSVAEAAIITARLRPNPVFSAGWDYLDLLGTGFNGSNGGGPSEYNFRTDFLLERGGKREKRIDLAEKTLNVTQAQFLNTTRLLILEVQSGCIEVLLAKAGLLLAQDNLKSFTGLVEVNTARVAAGDLAEVELVRSRIAALQYQNAMLQADSRLRAAKTRLQTLLGRASFNPDFDVADELKAAGEPPSLEILRSQALQSRPDLIALRRDRERFASDLTLQQAQRKIDYTLGAQFHRQYDNATGSSLGLFLSVPLPLYNRNQGEIERARKQMEQAEARVKAMESDIRTEVENSYLQYATARDLLDNIERNMLAQAREVRETTEYSYRRGEASFVELLDAQRAFNDTIQSYNEARTELMRSIYLIESATGKGANP